MVREKIRHQRFASSLTKACLFIGFGIFSALLRAKPVLSAERITTFIGPLQISIAVDSIETFAREGKINSDLALITNRLDEPTKVQLQEILQQRFEISPTFISRYARLPLVEATLNKIGRIVQPKPGLNGLTAMRSATILAAADPEKGLTIMNVLRHFPSQDIHLDFDLLWQLGKELNNLAQYRQVVVSETIGQSKLEAEASPIDVSQLEDLSQPGAWQVTKQVMSFDVGTPQATELGLASSYELNFEIYLPQDYPQPAPLIVIVQGFGASPDTYSYVAEQLASHGYAVASIEHLGTNLARRMALPYEELSSWILPTEFVSRPLDVTHLLNKLEELVADDPQWAARLNLDRVGVFGYSFGGYSALAIAGAEINHSRLTAECDRQKINTVLSFYFQCQARYLPPLTFDLKDSRIDAVFALYPLTNPIFGAEGISKIDIPTAIVTGSQDNVVPPVQNQIHPFLWLETPERYLVLLDPGTHLSTVKPENRGLDGIPSVEIDRQSNNKASIASGYLNTMSVAFFNRHLRGLEEYTPYLTAAYTQNISQEAIRINLVRSLDPKQLETAYGKKPPIELFPQSVLAAKAPKEETILAEIKRTGVLKVALRSDAAPFSYLNNNLNWTGYCASLINSLEDYLEIKLDRPGGIQIVALPSNLKNRYQLIQQKQVHLECGANKIENNLEGVSFSQPFFVTETKSISEGDRSEEIEGNNNDVPIGTQPLESKDYRMLLPTSDRLWQETINNFLSSRDK